MLYLPLSLITEQAQLRNCHGEGERGTFSAMNLPAVKWKEPSEQP